MDITQHRPTSGWIEVITGACSAARARSSIRRLRRAQIARQKVQIFKPMIDDRYAERPHHLAHRDADSSRTPSRRAKSGEHVDLETEVIGIDEGQFFDQELADSVQPLADQGKRVLVAGLDRTTSASPSSQCRSCCRLPSTSRRRAPSACVCGKPASTRSG